MLLQIVENVLTTVEYVVKCCCHHFAGFENVVSAVSTLV